MKKKTLVVHSLLVTLIVLACAGSAVSALVTEQTWNFNNGDSPAVADIFNNTNGTPTATMSVTGGVHVPFPGWKTSWLGHSGAWAGDVVDVTLDIPNFINNNPYKEIWVNVTFFGFLNDAAILQPQGGVTNLGQSIVDLPDGWKTLSIGWRIEPNPNFESIYLKFIDSGAALDDVFVHTDCIPEPATICLLGLGALALRRKA